MAQHHVLKVNNDIIFAKQKGFYKLAETQNLFNMNKALNDDFTELYKEVENHAQKTAAWKNRMTEMTTQGSLVHCGDCEKVFGTEVDLIDHIISEHMGKMEQSGSFKDYYETFKEEK